MRVREQRANAEKFHGAFIVLSVKRWCAGRFQTEVRLKRQRQQRFTF